MSDSGRRAASALVLLALTGCAGVDNSGGEPPPGTDVSIESPLGLDAISPCVGGGQDCALLLDDEAAVDTWLAECASQDTTAQRDALVAAIDDLDDSQRLVGVRVVLGGCVQQWSFRGIYLDDNRLNVWILKEDTSYGLASADCTDDIGWDEGYWIAAEADVSAVTEATLTVGVYNPDLPGAPALPGG